MQKSEQYYSIKDQKYRYINSRENIVVGTILIGFLVNILYVVVLDELGIRKGVPFFVFTGDPFADFFKSSLSYISYDIEDFRVLPNIYSYLGDNPYKGYDGLSNISILTNFHNPPGTVLIKLFQAHLIEALGPIVSLCLVSVLLLMMIAFAARRAGEYDSVYDAVYLVAFSYPVLFAIFRGNTQSLASGALLIGFMTLAVKDKLFILRNLMLAVSVSMRPISAVFILYFFIKKDFKAFILNAVIFVCFSGLILWITFMIDGYYYAGYDIYTFLEGVRHYKWIYIESPRFLQEEFNASIYALIRNNELCVVGVEKIRFWMYLSIVAILIMAKGIDRIGGSVFTDVEIMYLLYCVYVFVFPVSADYHMIALLGIIGMLLKEIKVNERIVLEIILMIALFIIIPKNFLGKGLYKLCMWGHYYDLQFFINTLLIFGGMLLVLVRGFVNALINRIVKSGRMSLIARSANN